MSVLGWKRLQADWDEQGICWSNQANDKFCCICCKLGWGICLFSNTTQLDL